MAQRTAPLLPATEELLLRLGERLRLARQRRRLTSKQVAERAGMAPMTLRSLERGGSGVTMGAYLAVMQVLGIERDLDLLGQADPLGRELQDSRLSAGRAVATTVRAGAPHKSAADASSQKVNSMPAPVRVAAVRKTRAPRVDAPASTARKSSQPAGDAIGWMDDSGFSSSSVLADLIKPAASMPKKRRR